MKMSIYNSSEEQKWGVVICTGNTNFFTKFVSIFFLNLNFVEHKIMECLTE